jgi:hypothetical protein
VRRSRGRSLPGVEELPPGARRSSLSPDMAAGSARPCSALQRGARPPQSSSMRRSSSLLQLGVAPPDGHQWSWICHRRCCRAQ